VESPHCHCGDGGSVTRMGRQMLFYRLEYGSFYLYENYDADPYRMVLMTDEVAMAYDPDTYTMFKHGTPEHVREYVETAKKSGIIMNIITFSKEYPVEKINKVLSTSGYLRYILNEPAD
jgi:hypothetical protein